MGFFQTGMQNAAGQIGQSFNPTEQNPMPQAPGGGSGGSPIQQAIQILRVRMPHVFGAGAPAPSALLNSQGAGSLLPAIQRLFQGSGMWGQMAQGMAPTTPPPMGGGPMMPPAQQAPPAGVQTSPGKAPTPSAHYEPLPGGTAGPGPMPRPPQRGPFFGKFPQQ